MQLLKEEMTKGRARPNLLPMVEETENAGLPIRYPEFASRLRDAMKEKDISVTTIKSTLKITYEMARRYTLGQAMPRQVKLEELARLCGLSPSFLSYGESSSTEMSVTLGSIDQQKRRVDDFGLVAADDTLAEVGRIQYWDAKGSCGGGYLNHEQLPKGHLIKEIGFFRKYGVKPENAFAVYADGESMAEFIVHGDMVIFDKMLTVPVSGKIFLVDHPQGLRIKRLHRDIDGSWTLKSNNPDKNKFPDERVALDQIDLLKIRGQFIYRQGGEF
jgi:phage repressor protein C with HTH and peptisase S24 domain